ncbi:hypothetical protein CUMW_279190 [Citrus unshiu]|uniref:Uncharacterized protein n=1 Tax=Citrus unshiu TaxID=55188 RepID=A0A2H5N875_CITUN|nr:hypothetical protein CUMW_279190 [Citrus unshiu]
MRAKKPAAVPTESLLSLHCVVVVHLRRPGECCNATAENEFNSTQ